jgi:phage gp29-like protein
VSPAEYERRFHQDREDATVTSSHASAKAGQGHHWSSARSSFFTPQAASQVVDRSEMGTIRASFDVIERAEH